MSRRASRPSGNRARPRAAAGGDKPLQHLTHLLAARGTDEAEAALDRWVDALVESPEVFRASTGFLATSGAAARDTATTDTATTDTATTDTATTDTATTDTATSDTSGTNTAGPTATAGRDTAGPTATAGTDTAGPTATAGHSKTTGRGFSRDERWLLLSIAAEMADDPVLGDCCEELERRMEQEALQWEGLADTSANYESMRQESPLYRALSDAWSSVRLAIEVSFFRDIGMTEMARALLEDVNSWERALRDGEATMLGVPRIVLTADDDPFGILLP